MALTISTNVFFVQALRHLSARQAGLATTIQRLSSGQRVNSAKDAGEVGDQRMHAHLVTGMVTFPMKLHNLLTSKFSKAQARPWWGRRMPCQSRF